MRENEFEKKMQEKMEELQLRPSESVWPKVERQLVQKKRRRFAYFFFLLAGLALVGYMGYTFLQTEKSPVTKQENENSINNPATTNKNNISSTDKNNTVNTATNNENNPAVATKTPGNDGITVTNTTSLTDNAPDKTRGATSKESPESIEKKLTNKKSGTTAPANTDRTKGNPRKLKEKEDGQAEFNTTNPAIAKKRQNNVPSRADQPVNNNPSSPVEQQKPDEQVVAKAIPEEKLTDIAVDSTQNKKQDITAIDTLASSQDKPIIAKNDKKRSKIKWGFDMSAGKNFSLDKAFSVLHANNSYSQYDALNSGTFGVPNANPGGSPSPLPPSDIKAKAGFKAGIVAEKKIGKRSSLTAGLRYAYLSEQLKTGRYENRAVISNSYQYNAIQNGVYRSIQEKTYINKYHFVELPILYQLQLNKSAKTGILWNAGISLNYLVATNALIYDTAAGGVYYKENSAYNRLHLNFRTGLSLRFGAESKLQWSIGPELSMSTTPLLKEDAILKKRYLMYGGLTARFMLPQKKK